MVHTLRRHLTNQFCYIIPILIYSIPAVLCFFLFMQSSIGLQILYILLFPICYTLFFIFIAGTLSRPFQNGIIPGKFPRDSGHIVYYKRKIYGTCWTSVFYFKPIYFLILNSKILKTLTFRIFGYKGNMNFTTYPDVWIRDLVLLELGNDAYLSNRCTIGTNICHMNKTISVDKIIIGEKSIIGHLAMIAHGCSIGKFSEIGVGCGIGINTSIGDNVNIGPMCTINHYVKIGNKVRIGTKSYIGTGANISENISIPAGSLIPEKAVIKSQDDVNKYISSVYQFNASKNTNITVS